MTDLNASIPLPPRSEEEQAKAEVWLRHLRGLLGRPQDAAPQPETEGETDVG